MSKVITFPYNGKDYTLEYTRRTVKDMEAKGFVASDVADKPLTILPKLFAGAFLAHHPTVKTSEIDKMYALFPRKKELISRLAEMYADPIQTLTSEPDEEMGNIEWSANWEQETDQDE